MKPPQRPPTWNEWAAKLPKARLGEIIRLIPEAARRDRYLPWDEVRRRPIPVPLGKEEWWLTLKLARDAGTRLLGFCDTAGTSFRFSTPDRVMAQLHAIDRGLGITAGLPDGVGRTEAGEDYIVSSLIEESITSSQLEGAATTREIAKDMLRTGRRPLDPGERMILNNYRTMERIRAMKDQPLTPDLVLEAHGIVTDGTLGKPDAAGRLRREDENVRVEDAEGTVFHVPPPASELPRRMAEMCAFANGAAPDFFIHPVVRAIILHFWLAYDHPFVDGNGRTARALFYWSMLRRNYRLFEYISISQILLRAPIRYARAFLQTETDDGDLTYFILHQVEVIHEAVEALRAWVRRRTAEVDAVGKRLRGLTGFNYRQQALLANALREPRARYHIEGHRRTHGVSFQTARDDLFALAARGLLEMRKEGRVNVFHPASRLDERLTGAGSGAHSGT